MVVSSELILFFFSSPSPSASSSEDDYLIDAPALTILLFTLPPHTWTGIYEAKLSTVINNLVSIENLPPLLKNEV